MSDRQFIRSLAGRARRGDQRTPSPRGSLVSTPIERARARASLVDSAVYVDGHRVESPSTLGYTYRALHTHENAVAWIGLYRPDQHELASLAAEFDLHELAVEDAILAHQRPKLERYDDTLFVVLRAARYLDDVEAVEFGEVHVFVGPNFVIAIRHAESPNLAKVRARLEGAPELLRRGPLGVLYAIGMSNSGGSLVGR